MEGLVTLLLFAGLFFILMRWGCGAHASHGQGDHRTHGHGGPRAPGHRGHEPAPSAAGRGLPAGTDPVCGMPVGPDSGYSLTYDGHQLRFCSRACLDRFESAPDRYRGA